MSQVGGGAYMSQVGGGAYMSQVGGGVYMSEATLIYALLFVKCPEYSFSYGKATFKKLRRGWK